MALAFLLVFAGCQGTSETDISVGDETTARDAFDADDGDLPPDGPAVDAEPDGGLPDGGLPDGWQPDAPVELPVGDSVITDPAARCVAAGNCWMNGICRAQGYPCDDGEPCTHTDSCTDGVCKGTRIYCNENPAVCGRQPYCDGTKTCKAKFPSGISCNDWNQCTWNDTCDGAGRCIGMSQTDCTVFNGVGGCDKDAGCFIESCIAGYLPETYSLECRPGFVQVAAGGDQTCAVTADGFVACWGRNNLGQLGYGNLLDNSSPHKIRGGGNAARVAVGDFHACMARRNGTAACWGDNSNGQLGTGTPDGSAEPVDVSGMTDGVTAICAGGGHTCAVRNGALHCWGLNDAGQVGVGSLDPTFAVPQTVDIQGVVDVACGAKHTCALTDVGQVWCWGDDGFGQLGLGDVTTRLEPELAANDAADVALLTCGALTSCWVVRGADTPDIGGASDSGGAADIVQPDDVVASSGEMSLYCQGYDGSGQIGGVGADTCGVFQCALNSTLVMSWDAADGEAVAMASGGAHSCVSLGGGVISCAGSGGHGQLGDSWAADSASFQNRVSLNVRQLAAGFNHTCALKSDWSIACWGDNKYGQLGNRTTLQHNSPTDIFWNSY